MYIGHRCACGHTDLHHLGDQTRGGCTASAGKACGQPCGPAGESLLLPSFDLRGRQVERVLPPGSGWPTMNGAVSPKTCPCPDCEALHAEVTAA